eukprot:2454886-Rhodomonas_salina.4
MVVMMGNEEFMNMCRGTVQEEKAVPNGVTQTAVPESFDRSIVQDPRDSLRQSAPASQPAPHLEEIQTPESRISVTFVREVRFLASDFGCTLLQAPALEADVASSWRVASDEEHVTLMHASTGTVIELVGRSNGWLQCRDSKWHMVVSPFFTA